MIKAIQTLVVAAVAVGLTLGSVGSAFAAEPPPTNVLNISGTVVQKGEANQSESFIELKTGKGLVRVLVTPETKYNVPSEVKFGFEDIKVDDRVKVIVTKINSNLIASEVAILPQLMYKPQLLRKVQIKSPPGQIKKIWLNLPSQQIKRVLIPLPPRLANSTLVNIPPQMIKVWIHLTPKQIKLVRKYLQPQPNLIEPKQPNN
jgi:hypothetical protein